MDRAVRREELLHIDRVIRRVRWIAVVVTFPAVALYEPTLDVEVPFSQVPLGLLLSVLLGGVNVASLVARRVQSVGTMRRLGALQMVADAAFVLGLNWLFAFDPSAPLWPALVLPVIEGAVRAQLRGAVATWGVVALGFLGRELFAAANYADVVDGLGSGRLVTELGYRMGLLLLVALAIGTMSRNLVRQVAEQERHRGDAEHRAELLHTVATASRQMASLEPGEVLDTVLDAVAAIGFEGSEIALLEERGTRYRTVHTRGLPAAYVNRSIPVTSGAGGRALAERSVVVIDDYALFDGAIPEIVPLGFKAVVAVPVWVGRELEGVLVAGTRRDRSVLEHEIECLELLAGQAGTALSNARRYNERKTYERQLTHQAFHDALTGIPNRTLFLQCLEEALVKPRRGIVAVLFVDLDRFKTINDSLGHEAGDALLRMVASRLEANLRPGDVVARYGGDEFTILLQNVDAPSRVANVADRVLAALREPYVFDGRDLVVNGSIGVALTHPAEEDDRDLLREADLAMYSAKEDGGDCRRVYDPTMIRRVRQRLEVETEMRRALSEGGFELDYQPIVSLDTGEIIAFEALGRWRHPELGSVAPADFFGLAEETGLIVPLGRWVLREACRTAAAWMEIRPSNPVAICVNVSPRELSEPRFVDHLSEVLEDTGLPPHRLIIEVTENAVLEDDEALHRLTMSLSEIGVRFAIDDFGLGFGSLGNLQRFPFDVLKIDRSFVARLHRAEDRAIVRSILSLGKELGRTVVAEGVQAPEHLDQLRELGCSFVQGFLLHRPMESTAAARLLEAAERQPDVGLLPA